MLDLVAFFTINNYRLKLIKEIEILEVSYRRTSPPPIQYTHTHKNIGKCIVRR